MSHEAQTRPLLIIEPEWEWYYYIPLLDRNEWDGIEYDQIQYSWNELDYRFGVDYPQVPESSTTGLTIGLIILMCVAFKKLVK